MTLRGAARFARAENRVVRPRDFRGDYAEPWAEFNRLARRGVLQKVAHGYYVVVPEEHRGEHWRPELEAVALGMGIADYGRDRVALVGPSAARLLGAIPRALGTATIAVPRQRPALTTPLGRVQFVTRNIAQLDTQRAATELVVGWVTTPEQTALDLSDRPTLGNVTSATAGEAIRALAERCDPHLVEELSRRQRKVSAWQRYAWLSGLPVERPRRKVPTRGLRGEGDPDAYGLIVTTA
jgi:hypothetical protein